MYNAYSKLTVANLGANISVVISISRPRSRDSSAIELILQRSRFTMVSKPKVQMSWSWTYLSRSEGLGLGLERLVRSCAVHLLQQLSCCTLAVCHHYLHKYAVHRSHGWPLFRKDKRFAKMHKFQEKVLCVPATSAAVERVFCHGGFSFVPTGPA